MIQSMPIIVVINIYRVPCPDQAAIVSFNPLMEGVKKYSPPRETTHSSFKEMFTLQLGNFQ